MYKITQQGALWNVTFPIALGARYLTSRLGSLDRSATSLDTAIVSRALQVHLKFKTKLIQIFG